jgi:hypothetical protein
MEGGHKTFRIPHVLGALSWLSRMIDVTDSIFWYGLSSSKPCLEGRICDSHHTAEVHTYPLGGKTSYVLKNLFSSHTDRCTRHPRPHSHTKWALKFYRIRVRPLPSYIVIGVSL